MKLNLKQFILSIRSSFWFIPIILSVTGIILALYALDIDQAFQSWNIYTYFSFLTLPIETARSVLSTIAGAMITVVSLVFSMTLVALILVSQQLGPRILIQFMDDRPTQITLGLFNATFLFSLIVLMRVDTGAEIGEVKGLTIAISVILTIASIATLIHFLHHIATRIQADIIVGELGRDLTKAARAHINRLDEPHHQIKNTEYQKLIKTLEGKPSTDITLKRCGYIQQLEETIASNIAEK